MDRRLIITHFRLSQNSRLTVYSRTFIPNFSVWDTTPSKTLTLARGYHCMKLFQTAGPNYLPHWPLRGLRCFSRSSIRSNCLSQDLWLFTSRWRWPRTARHALYYGWHPVHTSYQPKSPETVQSKPYRRTLLHLCLDALDILPRRPPPMTSLDP